VNFVTFGAGLVSFRAARQQRLRLCLVALHATTALGDPSVRRVTAGATAMAASLRADIRVTSALHVTRGAGYTRYLKGSMLLVTLSAPNVPKRDLIGIRPHLNFVATVARLLGDQPSSRSRCDGSLRVSGICVYLLAVGRRLNRRAIRSPVRLVTHFAVHAAVEHVRGDATGFLQFSLRN
jgi:hypothetical protein